MAVALSASSGCARRQDAAATPKWRSGWVGLADPDKVIACAQETGFNALIVSGSGPKLEEFAKKAREAHIECYWGFNIIPEKGQEHLAQVMLPAEEEALKRLQADEDPHKHGYQFGGEPLCFWQQDRTMPAEVLIYHVLCFHRPEVRELVKKRIREQVEACPSLSGVAFDFFGYQNYRACHCDVSQQQFAQWRKAHQALKEDEALDQFSLETLVEFNNEMADYVRSLRPGLKVTAHIYPVFLPEPLYANRLKLDYCCQTTAWFFEPYWPDEKVTRYADAIVKDGSKYYKTCRGIPFIGLYVGLPGADKPLERFSHELDLVFSATRGTSVSIYDYDEVVRREAYRKAIIEATTKYQGGAPSQP
jgi:hypothetical protein